MEKTNLNVNPYYDDFDEDKNFHRVLFRPGFAVQARELTQLQTILQNQIERHGRHVFKEGTVIIPGSVGFTNEYFAVKLESTISGNDIADYVDEYIGTRITGTTSGVIAEVISVEQATTSDPITLFVKYVKTGTDNVTTRFTDDEYISSDAVVGGFGIGVDSAKLISTNATATGSSANIEEGVYFIRGHFVRVDKQRIILDKYTNSPSYRIGLTITETLETPEEDSTLLDNAQGSSNLNAKGAHRLKFNLTLSKLPLDTTDDENFVELMRLKNGSLQEKARNTEYSVLAETLARRTYDQSGDFFVRAFDVDIRETLNDGFNNGVYLDGVTTDSGNLASEAYITAQISPGKAYVSGYEIETIAPKFIDIPKPRTFENYNGGVTPVEVGNYVIVNNIYNAPEISPFISGEIDEPYKQIDLYDTKTATRKSASGSKIGYARVRGFEHFENNTSGAVDSLVSSSNTDTKFKLYLFDIRMSTKLTMSANIDTGLLVAGAKVTGGTSGAIGYITSDSTGAVFVLTTVVGNFVIGEKIKITSSTEADEFVEDSSANDLTIDSIQSFDFSSVKQVFMDNTDANKTFTADLFLDTNYSLSGLVTYSGTGTTISGFQTSFLTELRVGDIVAFPSGTSGALEERRITAVTNDTTISISATLSAAITSVQATRKRAGLIDQNKNILLRKLQKKSIKTLKTESNNGISDSSVTVRRSFVDTSTASGVISFTLGANETFGAVDNTDYVLTVLAAGSGGSAAAGDIVNLESDEITISNVGNSLTITSAAILGNGAEVRLIATVIRTVVSEKTKSRIRASMVVVDNDGIGGGAEYGTSAHHKDISLGVADAFKLHVVYDSEDDTQNPVLPEWTITGASGVFTKGEIITGQSSGAKARIISTTSPITIIPLNSISFVVGEQIIGDESEEYATLDTFTAGSRNVTNRYVFDSGQRDNFYDISRIIRKPSAVAPTGRLLIIFDYFTHGTGSFFTVDSYSSIDYKDIPTYTATRVDPEVREPTGEYDLRDCVDFRPRVQDSSSSTVTIQTQSVKKITSHSFNFENRLFSGSGSSVINIPKDNSNFLYDFDFYLGRIDMLIVTYLGEFRAVLGTPAENPIPPKKPDNSMKLLEASLSPYMIEIKDATITRDLKKKYTSADIGRLEQRISNIEYYTSLNLLEKDAQSFEVLDENGFSRFKSGFLVDGFSGHSVGDVAHPDYRCSIDMQNYELRPKYFMKGVSLEEENTTTTARSNNFYQITGDVITLPYEHVISSEQSFATRVENLNPVLYFSWAGECKLSPSGDEWFEVERIPDLIINREGNFDTVLAQNRNALGTVWNAWQTQWTGTQTSTTLIDAGNIIIRRTFQTQTTNQTRSGIQTNIVAQIDQTSLGDRIVSQAVIPFIRSRNVTFTAAGLKPFTRVYPFFDRTNVSNFVTPTGGSQGDSLITSGLGSISGTFLIPNPNVNGNPRFRTGERQFRLTSDVNNGTEGVETFAQAIYSATGILNTIQETIVATRNARIQTQQVSQSVTTSRRTQVSDQVFVPQPVIPPRRVDPLAQSFVCNSIGGEYITKIDIFFQQKSADIPVLCQIREMKNGYPTLNVLPFGSKLLQASEVNVSDDASVATTFTFDSPVYLRDDVEYCFVLLSNSDKYLVWISRMGDVDISGNRLVSEQPSLGVLFKSQNNSTWTAYDFEDLKFTLYRASFDTSAVANINFVNQSLPVKTLNENPIRTFSGLNLVKVFHENHHMYSTSNNVIISDVSSEIQTTLSANLVSGGTSMSLSSSSGFPTSGTVYVKIDDEVISGTISGTTISSLTRGVEGSDVAHTSGTTVELYMLNGIPLTEVNKTHTALANIQMDSYTVATTTNATSSGTGGGSSVTATENALADQIQTLVPVIEHPQTSLSMSLRMTSGTSPSGSQSSFVRDTANQAKVVTINNNYTFSNPKIVCSDINESLELGGQKSVILNFQMTTEVDNLSPLIDTDRKTLVAVANRLDNISSSSDVYPTEDYVAGTEPDGDSLEGIYCTKKVQLKTPATSIKLLFDAVQLNSAGIEAMYKILRSDDASDFDEIGWSYFNTDGSTDNVVNSSTTNDDFIEREYTANNLEEFIAFAIKLRLKGTNSTEPPRIKNLRAIALAT